MPTPITVPLADALGFQLREKVAKYVLENQNRTGAERGNANEQGYGALAEIIVRNGLGLPEINPAIIQSDMASKVQVALDVISYGSAH